MQLDPGYVFAGLAGTRVKRAPGSTEQPLARDHGHRCTTPSSAGEN